MAFVAPRRAPSPPSGKPENAVVAKRWETALVTDGSVPSPDLQDNRITRCCESLMLFNKIEQV
ncbi:hypothetical protein EJB05_33019, partial [Eragrostis curvula]